MNNKLPLTLGWDLGGAHLKAALVDADGRALRVFQQPCPLWRGSAHLEQAIAAVMAGLGDSPLRHTVTMTGELADIFPSRGEGVAHLTQLMADRLGDADLLIYAGRSGLVATHAVLEHLADIASANWHASAAFLAARGAQGLFIDVGSTTADLVVLHHGQLATRGYSDAERMRYDELVYTGAIRMPVMAVAQQLPFSGEWQRLAAEHFATMADVYRLTGELPESYDMADTADGGEKTPQASARRLARMVGRDLQDAPMPQWRQLAFAVRSQQLHLLQFAVERTLSHALLDDEAPLIGAGAGRFLVRELASRLGRKYRDASEWVTAVPETAEWAGICLPAYAVAWLARNEA